MHVIHFTQGATDFLRHFNARHTRSVQLADGEGDIHINCLYLLAGASIGAPPVTHDCALLVVHGRVAVTGTDSAGLLNLSAGVGVVIKAGESYSLESASGAILIAIESRHLAAAAAGISTPARVAGQCWPG